MAQTSVTTTATLLTSGSGRAAIQNRGAVAVYIGTANTVTTSTGLQLDPGQALTVEMAPSDALYGIVAAGTATVHSLVTGDGT